MFLHFPTFLRNKVYIKLIINLNETFIIHYKKHQKRKKISELKFINYLKIHTNFVEISVH